MQRLVRTAGEMHHLDIMAHRSGAEWRRQRYPDDLDNESHLANVEMIKLTVRIRDDSIRSIAKELKERCNSAVFSTTEADGHRLVLEMANIFETLNERIGERLRQLDDDEDTHDQPASAR